MNDIRDELNHRRVAEEQRLIHKKAEDWKSRIPGLSVNMNQIFNKCYPGAVALILSRDTEAGEERLWTGFNYASQSIIRAEKIVRRLEAQL